MRSTLITVLAILALMVGFAAPLTAQPYEIVWNLNKGDVVWVRSKIVQQIDQQVNGQPMNTSQNILLDLKTEVLAVPEPGVFQSEITIDRIMMDSQNPEMSFKYDSSSPEATDFPAAKVLQAFVKAPFTVVMDKYGDVRSIEGLDQLMKNAATSDPSAPPQMKEMFTKMFNPDAFEKMFEQNTACYPDHPVSVGDTWTQQMDMDLGFSMSIGTKYTLKDVTADGYVISMDGTFDNPSSTPIELDQEGTTMTMNLKGTQTGEMVIDRSTGNIKTSEMVQDIAGNITVSPAGQETMEIPMKIHSTVSAESKF